MEENPRKPRRFQVRLRTLFLVTTVAAVLVAVAVPVTRHVIQKREESRVKEELKAANRYVGTTRTGDVVYFGADYDAVELQPTSHAPTGQTASTPSPSP